MNANTRTKNKITLTFIKKNRGYLSTKSKLVCKDQGPVLQCFLRVKEDLS